MHPMVTRAKARIFKPLECMTYHVTITSRLPHSHVHALRDSNWKEAMTPVDNESKLGPDGDLVSDSTLFRSLVGCPVTCDPLLEAEYHGVANVVAATAWIRNLLLELHAPLHSVTLVYYDNFQYADIFTKGLLSALFLEFRSSLNVEHLTF
nr:hypothetical protein [Tanacetum cinerariifolium]GEZ40818.1 hypothetical protein [Tanacetum cinerariifolium]